MKANLHLPRPLDEIALTLADIGAMRQSAEDAHSLSGDEYLRFLESASAGVEPSRRTSAGWSPFDLRDASLPGQ
jgi:hypothetical protein